MHQWHRSIVQLWPTISCEGNRYPSTNYSRGQWGPMCCVRRWQLTMNHILLDIHKEVQYGTKSRAGGSGRDPAKLKPAETSTHPWWMIRPATNCRLWWKKSMVLAAMIIWCCMMLRVRGVMRMVSWLVSWESFLRMVYCNVVLCLVLCVVACFLCAEAHGCT